MKGYLVLEDGTTMEGEAFGAAGMRTGEVVFNTSMTGYQEVLTDPSYVGQIVVMTYPLIGNYGTASNHMESGRSHVRGLVVKERTRSASHWRSERDLDAFLMSQGVTGLEGIDTRELTRKLREFGTMKGVITSGTSGAVSEAADYARVAAELEYHDHVREVSTPHPYRIFGDGPKVVVMDFGVKKHIVNSLVERDCDVAVVPAATGLWDILDMKPAGVLLSNGPGDPKDLPEVVETIRGLISRLPMFGICLGHQLLALALDADTTRMKYGHRGSNHPVKELSSGRVYITSQNHGYVVDDGSLPRGLKVSHVNVNDGTIEGLEHERLKVFSVQYHPEASPGPRDSDYLFERFLRGLV